MWVKGTLWKVIVLIFFMEKVVQGKKIFCYYSSFSQTRQGLGNFLPENINPHLCTHLIYAFVDISPDGRDLVPFNRNDQGPTGLYARTLALKEQNPSLKVLLAVGGWQIGSKPFIPMVRDGGNRREWTRNVVAYLRRHKFDGFDVDWEFPATRGSPAEDKYRFTLMMKGLYEAFAEEAAESGQEKLLLTLATASGTFYINQSYEPGEIIKYIDYMLLMTYNYHGQWEKITGHHSGLNRYRDDPTSGEKSQLFQQWSIDYWLEVGIPKEKLIVGIPTYGMSFTLTDPVDNGVRAPATGGGRMGDYTRETGILAYYEVCLNLKDKNWRSVWIDDQEAPYAYSGDQWVGYDNRRSVVLKADNIMARGLAGAFVWSLEMDDFRGKCGEGPYPLLATIMDILGGQKLAKAAARQPIAHSHSLAQDVTKRQDKRTRLYPTPSRVSRLQKSGVNDTKLGTIWSKHVWEKLHRLVEIGKSMITTTPAPSTTSPVLEVTTTGRTHPSFIPWWSGSVWGRTGLSKPSDLSSLRKHRYESWLHKTVRRGHIKGSLSKGIPHESKMALVLPSREGHEVKSWQTTRWWTGASEGTGAVYEEEQINARATGRPGMGLQIERTTRATLSTTSQPVVNTTTRTVKEIQHITDSQESRLCRILGVGTFPDPYSCEHFIICMSGNWLDYPPHIMACPVGTRFDPYLKICNYASEVPCSH